jgi:MoaA/NifB/PqqE/SkfB family radical SAM enzyme
MISLVFVTTTECNLACPHCLRGNVSPQHLPLSIAQKAIEGAKKYGIESIHLTGGEPFLYHPIDLLFDLISQSGAQMTISTNGMLLSQNTQLIEKHKKSIRRLHISLDSCIPEAYEKIRGRGAFQKVLAAFEFCRIHKVSFGVNVCLNPFSKDSVADIAKFAKKQGAAQIIFTTVLPCTNARQNSMILEEAERKKLHEEILRIQRFAAIDIFKLLYVPIFVGEMIFASKDFVMCATQSLRTVAVDVDGSIHFCCALTVYDVPLSVERNLRLVSLKDVSFDEGLKIFARQMGRFLENRIVDSAAPASGERMDFCSCFYCNKKLGIAG